MGPGIIPVSTTRLVIGLGTNFIVNPAVSIATAPYSNYFTWSTQTNGGQVEIIGILHTALPVGFVGQLSFGIKASVQGTSTVTGNWLIINSNPTVWRLTDPNPGNNSTDITYTIVAGGPVPVTITKFAAQNKDCKINVNWSVAQEINVSRYEVEISKDGVNYEKAATVTASNKTDYSASFALTEPLRSPVLLVRLKAIDLDASFKYTQILSVSGLCAGAKTQQEIYCYPNPVINQDNITIASKGDLFKGKYTVTLIDATGRSYMTDEVVLDNVASFKFTFGNRILAGNYFLILRRADGTTNAVLPFVKY